MPATATKKNGKQERQELREHHVALASKWLKQNALDAQAEDVKTTLTAEDAKILLGWQEVERGDHHFLDTNRAKIVCHNNATNRELRIGDCQAAAQDILNRVWSYNGETITIGANGNVLSGQRRLIGLVFAEQIRNGPQSQHWATLWDGPVQIEAIVVFNVDESMKTTRTIDNTRPRKLSDAYYCDPELAKYTPADRKVVAKLMEDAIKVVWQRTGHGDNLFHVKKTNAEMCSFKDRHPKIVKAVKHIFDEDGSEKRISGPGRWVRPGVAAGLLYLMGSALSDGDDYRNPKKNKDGQVLRSERGLDWSMWDKACDFWVLLASVDDKGRSPDPAFDEFIRNMRKVRKHVADPSDKVSGFIYDEGTTRERAAALCKAWQVYMSGEKPTPGLFKLDFKVNDKNGEHELAEDPETGGIDIGWNPAKTNSVQDETEAKPSDPTPDEIADAAQAIKDENLQKEEATATGNLD